MIKQAINHTTLMNFLLLQITLRCNINPYKELKINCNETINETDNTEKKLKEENLKKELKTEKK